MILKQKSKFNSAASDLLINETYYAPSVHCSYYAAFQLMKVAIKNFSGITYDEIDRIVASSKSSEHRFIHLEILNVIHKNDFPEYSNLKRLINDLFQFRVNSDYKDIKVIVDDAIKAQAKSQEIVSYLEKMFHV